MKTGYVVLGVRALAVAAVALLGISGVVNAQQVGPTGGNVGRGSSTETRAAVIDRLVLADVLPSLRAEQRERIDRAVDGYLTDKARAPTQARLTPGGGSDLSALKVQLELHNKLNAAIAMAMDDEQRQAWRAAQAARMAQLKNKQ